MTQDELKTEMERHRRINLPCDPSNKWMVLAFENQRYLDLAIQAGESAYARGIEAGRDLQAREDANVECRYCREATFGLTEDGQWHTSALGCVLVVCDARLIRRARPGAFTS
jgi:hypothetical protein